MARETSVSAYQAIINSLAFARACQTAAIRARQAIERHPEDPRFTRQEVEDIAGDTRSSIGRRCQDLVAYGVFRENGTRVNMKRDEHGKLVQGNTVIAFEFTGNSARKGVKPHGKPQPKTPPSQALRLVCKEIKLIASQASEGLVLPATYNLAANETYAVARAALEGVCENMNYLVFRLEGGSLAPAEEKTE